MSLLSLSIRKVDLTRRGERRLECFEAILQRPAYGGPRQAFHGFVSAAVLPPTWPTIYVNASRVLPHRYIQEVPFNNILNVGEGLFAKYDLPKGATFLCMVRPTHASS
jgi:hypothetical protein